jgi:hypothetical protein
MDKKVLDEVKEEEPPKSESQLDRNLHDLI